MRANHPQISQIYADFFEGRAAEKTFYHKGHEVGGGFETRPYRREADG